MPKSQNQKLKLPLLCRLMLERTDEDHPITIKDMIDELEKWDIKAERKSLYSDMEHLRELGMDIQCRKGRTAGWYIGARDFELPELKLLVDAVQASRFITKKKSDSLIRKLESLASIYQAKQLQRQVYVTGQVKTMNETIYYNVDRLHAAVGRKRSINFRYFDYNSRKEKVYRHGGKLYAVSPCGLVWDDENYYLVGWDHEHQEIRHYRVDKMSDITVNRTGLQNGAKNVDMAGYAQKHFGMFSGEDATVTLRCREEMAGVVLDRFGQEVILIPGNDGWFTVTVPVVISPQFWGWLFGLGDQVELIAPQKAVEQYHERLKSVASVYQE